MTCFAGKKFTAGQQRFAKWGRAVGKRPPPSRTTIRGADGVAEDMDVMETRNVTAGVTLTLAQSGGGGYGDPFTRPAELVLRDVRDGYVAPVAAAHDYGVVFDDGGEVDEAATEARRSRR